MREIVTPIRHPGQKIWGFLGAIESTPTGKENGTISLSVQVIPNGGQ